jgi:hypothetical protein
MGLSDLARTLMVVLVGRPTVHMGGAIDTVRIADAAGMPLALEHLVVVPEDPLAERQPRRAV